MIPILAMVKKELRLFQRDPGGLLMLFVLPAVFIVVLSVALQGPFSSATNQDKVDVLIADQDSGEMGRRLVEHLHETGIFNPVTRLDGEALTREQAESLLKSGRYRIAIALPEGSELALALEQDETIDIITDPVMSQKIVIAVESAIQSFVHISIISGLLSKVHEITVTSNRSPLPGAPVDPVGTSDADPVDPSEWQTQTQSPSYYGQRGLTVNRIYLSARGAEVFPNSVQQYVPGWTVFALFWIAQVLCLNIIEERATGAYKRILVSPITFSRYLWGKTIPFTLVNLIQALFMFCIGLYVLPLLGCTELLITNIQALVLVTLAISAAAISFGLLMASISKSAAFTSSITATILVILSVLGGIMVPRFIMPSTMQTLSAAIPHRWALDAYQDILVRNGTIEQILPEIGILLGFALCFFVGALIRISHLARKSR